MQELPHMGDRAQQRSNRKRAVRFTHKLTNMETTILIIILLIAGAALIVSAFQNPDP